MKIFQLICNLSKPLGICEAFNSKVVLAFLFLAYDAVFSSAFFLFKAVTLNEFIESFYISVTTLAYLSYFITLLWKKSNILKFIDDFENFIAKRKYWNLFESTSCPPLSRGLFQVVNV